MISAPFPDWQRLTSDNVLFPKVQIPVSVVLYAFDVFQNNFREINFCPDKSFHTVSTRALLPVLGLFAWIRVRNTDEKRGPFLTTNPKWILRPRLRPKVTKHVLLRLRYLRVRQIHTFYFGKGQWISTSIFNRYWQHVGSGLRCSLEVE